MSAAADTVERGRAAARAEGVTDDTDLAHAHYMGLLDQSTTPANGYAPGAFASTDPSVLPLRNASLGDIIEFTWSPPAS